MIFIWHSFIYFGIHYIKEAKYNKISRKNSLIIFQRHWKRILRRGVKWEIKEPCQLQQEGDWWEISKGRLLLQHNKLYYVPLMQTSHLHWLRSSSYCLLKEFTAESKLNHSPPRPFFSRYPLFLKQTKKVTPLFLTVIQIGACKLYKTL